jgi:hypothetical protein
MINPTKCRLRRCAVNGEDVRLHTNCITVFETMCKPYVTTTIRFIDKNNVITKIPMNIGTPVSYAFDGGGKVYESTQHIIVPPSEGVPVPGLRALQYEITTAGPSYFGDRANLVQRADVNITGTQVIDKIFGEFLGDAPLRKIGASLGMIAKTTAGGHVIDNMKPFTAIQDVMKNLSYGGTKTGSTVFFRAYDHYVLGPLEMIFAQMGSQATFEQRATWGSEWQHTFTTINAIIEAQQIDNGKGGADMAQASGAASSVFDITQGSDIVRKLMSAAGDASGFGGRGGVGGAIAQFAKKGGGFQNVFQVDSRKREPSTEQVMNKGAENSFQAAVKQATNYRIKVPIQSGINCTVGQGITAKLIAPLGDQPRGGYAFGGQMLAADIKHECFFDNRLVQGTTTFRAVQLGRNV